MTTQTAPVGAQVIPVPLTGQNSPITDPTVDGLLAFFGFLIKDALDAKLSEQGGPVSSAALTDACPVANRFPWNHNGTFMRPAQGTQASQLPALYAWETGSALREATLAYDVLDRTIVLQYIFPQLNNPTGMMAREGLLAAISHVFARGASRGYHPAFAITGSALGTPIYKSLGLTEWTMVSSQPGFLEPIPGGGTANGRSAGSGALQRGFPAYQATFKCSERIYPPQSDAGDQMADGKVSIAIRDGENPAALDLETGVLLPPDGSEDPPV